MPDHPEHDPTVDEMWRFFLTTGDIPDAKGPLGIKYKDFKRIMRHLPADPRCALCYAPFEGVGGPIMRTLFGRTRSQMNPHLCNVCEQFAQEFQGGAEVELSMLFADIRGSTQLAQSLSPAEYSRRISRFYQVTTDLLIDAYALIEKLIGDEVAGLFVPGVAGPDHARVAVEYAAAMLHATGHGSGEEPWAPIGIGVHTGVAFVGSVGSPDGLATITALGEAVNITARLASSAGRGEILVSEATARAARLETEGLEHRILSLKGVAQPFGVYVACVDTTLAFSDERLENTPHAADPS